MENNRPDSHCFFSVIVSMYIHTRACMTVFCEIAAFSFFSDFYSFELNHFQLNHNSFFCFLVFFCYFFKDVNSM